MDRKPHGFTLLELLVSVGILLVLAALSLAGVRTVWRSVDEAVSTSNLRQLGQAALLYASEHEGLLPLTCESQDGGVCWWYGFETLESGARGEGNRVLDPSRGPLWAYIQNLPEGGGCPTFLHSAILKPKYKNSAGFGYGYNEVLGPHPGIRRKIPEERKRLLQIERPGATILFVTSAQVNTFQPPATSRNPMLEEFYFVNERETTVHFRFGGRAAAVMASGDVQFLPMATGTVDRRMPKEQVGRLAPVGSFDYLK